MKQRPMAIAKKVFVVIGCLVAILVAAGYIGFQVLFPDDYCGDFSIGTFSEGSYKVLDEKVTDTATYTLFFDRKGYAGDSPEPFVGINKKLLNEPSVRKCGQEGSIFQHFIDADPVSGKLNIKTKTIILNFSDGRVSRIKISEEL